MGRLLEILAGLDRRWIFLLMAAAVVTPIALRMQFPERPTPLVQAVFDRIEALPPGSRVLLPFDYDPGSAPELQPMAVALTWHCATRGHRLYFVSLWPVGPRLIQDTIDQVLRSEFAEYRYGVDYVNLGYKPGFEGVIKVMATNLRELFTTDYAGTDLNDLPLTRDLKNISQMDLILNISAGYPGNKEWVQYAATPLNIPIAGGCTGVQAPLMYPYIPNQMFGLLGAIKGAAEYEAALQVRYPSYGRDASGRPRRAMTLGIFRMGPQLIAHCLVLALIVLGNIVQLRARARQVGRS